MRGMLGLPAVLEVVGWAGRWNEASKSPPPPVLPRKMNEKLPWLVSPGSDSFGGFVEPGHPAAFFMTMLKVISLNLEIEMEPRMNTDSHG
jgi:hypothetical protein